MASAPSQTRPTSIVASFNDFHTKFDTTQFLYFDFECDNHDMSEMATKSECYPKFNISEGTGFTNIRLVNEQYTVSYSGIIKPHVHRFTIMWTGYYWDKTYSVVVTNEIPKQDTSAAYVCFFTVCPSKVIHREQVSSGFAEPITIECNFVDYETLISLSCMKFKLPRSMLSSRLVAIIRNGLSHDILVMKTDVLKDYKTIDYVLDLNTFKIVESDAHELQADATYEIGLSKYIEPNISLIQTKRSREETSSSSSSSEMV